MTIPGDGSVTGQAFNGGTGFNNDRFLFVSEDGTISGWRGALGTTAENLQLPLPGNIYKGATLETVGGHSYLLSANFGTGNIDVLKGDNGAPDLAGKFTDPGIPNQFAPFNIAKLGNTIYVTYALQEWKGRQAGARERIRLCIRSERKLPGTNRQPGDAQFAVGVGDRAERVRLACRGPAGGKFRRWAHQHLQRRSQCARIPRPVDRRENRESRSRSMGSGD